MWIKLRSLEVIESVLIKMSKVPGWYVLKQVRHNITILKFNFNLHYHAYLQAVRYLNYADLHFYIQLCIQFCKLHCMLGNWFVLSKLNLGVLCWFATQRTLCISRIFKCNKMLWTFMWEVHCKYLQYIYRVNCLFGYRHEFKIFLCINDT